MKKKTTLIALVFSISTIIIVGGAFFIINRNQSPKPPSQIQDKNSNTYQQNETLFDNADSTNQDEKVTPGVNTERKVVATKPVLTKSASSAPTGVPIDFTCSSSEGADCQIILKNTTSSQLVYLEKKKITTDKVGQNNANWIWQTLTGSWQVTATATSGSTELISDAQTVEVKK